MVEYLQRPIGFVYGIQSFDLIKIGVAQDIEKRMNTMRLHNPHGIELVFWRKTYAPRRFEKRLHEILADKAVGREWFRVTLPELRQAAARAKSASVSAQQAFDRSMDKPIPEKLAIQWQNEAELPVTY